MTVLVAAASKHGATAEIAERIGAALHTHGVGADRPTWLFASGPIVGDPPVAGDADALRPGLAEELVEQTGAREHPLFAGKIDTGRLGLLERAAGRAAHASEGDVRDRQAIDAWAAGIADDLRQTSGR